MIRSRSKIKSIVFCTLFLFSFIALLYGSNNPSKNLTYQLPPKIMADIVDAPATPSVNIGPKSKWMLILSRPNLPSIEEVSQPKLRIAGIRINPKTNGPSRQWFYTGIKIKNIFSAEEKTVELPDDARISNLEWSPNGKWIAFTLTKQDKIELWTVEINSAAARKLTNAKINETRATPFVWLSDNKTLICATVPENREKAPQQLLTPSGPVIQQNLGKIAPARTYQDLLKNPHDESLFDYYLTSQLKQITLDGETSPINKPAIYDGFYPSPDGKYLLVETIHRPYSYILPVYRFPLKIGVWDLKGNLIYQVADLPLAEEIPVGFNAVRKGRRSVYWRADAPATLYWAEAQDKGDPNKEAEIRDKIFMLAAPFTVEPEPLISLSLRFNGINWSAGKLALVYEYWWRTRNVKTWIVQPDSRKSKPRILFDRSYEDRYSDPGRPVTKPNAEGFSVLFSHDKGKSLFLIGTGASPEGDRPFVDKLNLKNLKTKRLWRSAAPYYERPVTPIDKKGYQFITRRESKTEPPNYFLRNWKQDELKQLTSFPHPTPQLKNVQKEIIRYERDDAVQLTGTLYLPEDYSKGDGPLPVLMWAYPREFKSAKAAGQMRGSPYQFIRVRWSSPTLWLTQGYAILDGPTMPIIGEGDSQPNDTYVKQLVASAKAAIDELARRGVGDSNRVAIGGHSYGAFMTANLLAHSDLFAAGIARSGAYNRTLTPFGFQAEERTYWQAPEIYYNMSPFMHAPKVNEPILLIHGEADNNSGTFPLQSRRYYHALKGLGATVRLVFLPHESHSYRARESVMHVLWEQNQWLEKYVKNKAEAKVKVKKNKRL